MNSLEKENGYIRRIGLARQLLEMLEGSKSGLSNMANGLGLSGGLLGVGSIEPGPQSRQIA